MVRKIVMTGSRARYVEHRSKSTGEDDGRVIIMRGDDACYEERPTEEVNLAATTRGGETLIMNLRGRDAVMAYMAAVKEGKETPMSWPKFEKKYPGVCTRKVFYEWRNPDKLALYRDTVESYRAQLRGDLGTFGDTFSQEE